MDPNRQEIENKEISPIPEKRSVQGAERPAPDIGIEKEFFPEDRPESERSREQVRSEVHERPLSSLPSVANTQTGPTETHLSAEQVRAVETILEENLQAVFKSLDANQQIEFKSRGEATTRKIVELMSAVKFKVKEITQAIVRWLRFIPGVSDFFVEQEAKIKTDKLIELHLRQSNQK